MNYLFGSFTYLHLTVLKTNKSYLHEAQPSHDAANLECSSQRENLTSLTRWDFLGLRGSIIYHAIYSFKKKDYIYIGDHHVTSPRVHG